MKKSQVKAIGAPSVSGFMKGVFSSGTVWEIDYKCAYCKVDVTVQHDDSKSWHRCPCCKSNSILSHTNYYQMENEILKNLFK